MFATVKSWAWAIIAGLGALILALVYRAGGQAQRRQELERRVEGANVRAQADADAARTNAVDELRKRWMRGVETDTDKRE